MHDRAQNGAPPSRTGSDDDVGTEATTGFGYTGAWSGTIPPDPEDDLVGTTLCNTYVIERVLGEGGMGRVYQARHTRIERKQYAIKALHPEYVRNADVVKRFQREAEAAAAIPSDHVIGVYDVDRTPDGRPFLVVELLDGRELGDLLDQKGQLDVAYAVGIVRQICKALIAAHAQGVVHRDMKPENVFLTGDIARPHVKVLDFGISRLDGAASDGLTKTGMIMGTPSYMPPEQARGERVDHRADVYAVGCILYTALTGAVPFDRDDPSATVVAVLTEEPIRPRTLEPSLPEHLEAIVQRAMAKQPDDRFNTMDELYQALEHYDTLALGGQGPPVTLRDGTAPRPRQLTGSPSALEQQASAVRDARPLFVLLAFGLIGAVFLGLLTTAVSLVTLWRGRGPTSMELLIGLVAAVAAASTPLFLIAREVRRASWNNSVRMLELSESTRVGLMGGAAVYGFGWLTVAAIDHVYGARASWAGWDAVLFGTALVAGLAARASHGGSGWRALAWRPVIALPLGALWLGGVLAGAVWMRDYRGRTPAAVPPDAPLEATSASAGAESPEPPPPPPPVGTTASEAELQQAKQGGVMAMKELADKYPGDPVVIRSLLILAGAAENGLKLALDAAEKLYKLDPKALQDDVVIGILRRAADSATDVRARALAIISLQLGQKGPDLLYDLGGSTSAARNDARALLGSETVRKHATPACLIAHDLREAAACDKRAALLDRVSKEGDERSVAVLQPLTVGKKSGCGFLRLGACPAACASHAKAMQQAIQAIRTRHPQPKP